MTRSVRRILDLVARYKGAYAVGIVLLLATNALNLSIPWLLKLAFDGMKAGRGGRFVAVIGLAILGVALLRAIVRTWSRLAMLGSSRRIVRDLRERVFDHLQALPVSYYDRTATGDIVSRLINDLAHVRSLFGPVAMNFANTVALYVMAIALLVRLDAWLTLVALAPYLLMAAAVKRFSGRMHAESTAAQVALSRIASRLSENLNGIMVVKSSRREADEIRRFDALADEYYVANQKFSRTRSTLVPLMGAVGTVGTLAVLYFGGLRVMRGTFSLGDFVAFQTTLAMLSWPSIALGWILNALQRGLAALDRLEAITSEPIEPALSRPPPSIADGRRGLEIELRHCTFTHEGSGERRPALADVSFRLAAGGRLGVVGRTGSGKSTLVELVTGQRLPERGQVFVNGLDMVDVPLGWLRARVGAVPQGAFVFSTTLRDNVAYALEAPAAGGAVEAAVRDSGLVQDLPQLPNGLDTVLGERGVTLSGGQRQRVTLARALAKDPELLVLDDSLSAVDSETEREILARLEERRSRQGATEIIVSHRLSAVAACDEILVLHEGAVVERGTHAALVAKGGSYARTWREQELSRELSEVE